MVKVIKKDGNLENFDDNKIIRACKLASERALDKLEKRDYDEICNKVKSFIHSNYDENTNIPVLDLHAIVEKTLMELFPNSGEAYRQFRNYKRDSIQMLNEIHKKANAIRYIGDVSNANTDSSMVSTQRSLIYGELNKNIYKQTFLNNKELVAINDGYIYIHDMKDRLDSINCFRRDTRFITKDGVKSFYDFSDGDTTMVLTHKGNWEKAVVHSYGWKPIQKVTFKKGVPTSTEKTVYCTSNHRWILQDGTETTELKEGDKLWRIPDCTLFNWDELTLEQKKLWCRGFAKGDGSLIGKQGSQDNTINFMVVRLCGHKKEYAERFRDCGYSVKEMAHEDDLMAYLLDTTTKDIPFLSLDYTNMKYYIDGFMCADGHLNKTGRTSKFRGVQVTGEFNNYIYDFLNIAGHFVTTITDLTDQTTNFGKRSDITLSYKTSSTQERNGNWRVVSIEEAQLNPKAQVWCLEVENDHSFVLEGGIPTGNCCLFDVGNVLKGGFEMGNVWYNEPQTLDVAFDVISDLALSSASQQYGGWTAPRIDTILAPYAEKSYKKYYDEYLNIAVDFYQEDLGCGDLEKWADEYAMKKVYRDFEQGFQGWEYKFNTVASSRGDYPFIAISFGLDESKFGRMAIETALKTRMNGQGKKGHKKPVLFPKLTFLYDDNLHGTNKPMEYLFDLALQCSRKTMYPDFLSLSGRGYIPSMYKKYGKVVSLMGCRASLSPWYKKGGMHPLDETDEPIFEGRFNLGAISLHLPMILAKAREEKKDFYEVLDYYLEMIRNLHKKTYDFLGQKRASTNPLGFMQGGFLGGTLEANDKIEPLLKPMTMSFGITALNELQQLYNGKSLVEDNSFALEVMKYINDYVDRIKEEDGILYAIYGKTDCRI